MTTERFPSKAGFKTAGVGALVGTASAWFLKVMLAASTTVVVGAAVLAAVAVAGYLVGFRAGEATRRD